MEKYPPKFCPECGGTNIGAVPFWHKSNWMADPKNPDWIPFQGTGYDVWCEDCEASFDIVPGKEMDICWYDEHPEDIPPEGNKYYTDVLLRRNPPTKNCGNCQRFFSGFSEVENSEYHRIEIYCNLDKTKKVRYFRPCIYDPNRWIKIQSSTPKTKWEPERSVMRNAQSSASKVKE